MADASGRSRRRTGGHIAGPALRRDDYRVAAVPAGVTSRRGRAPARRRGRPMTDIRGSGRARRRHFHLPAGPRGPRRGLANRGRGRDALGKNGFPYERRPPRFGRSRPSESAARPSLLFHPVRSFPEKDGSGSSSRTSRSRSRATGRPSPRARASSSFGGRTMRLRPEQKAAYHAACSIVSNLSCHAARDGRNGAQARPGIRARRGSRPARSRARDLYGM